MSPFYVTVSFINCKFHGNSELIIITTAVCSAYDHCELIISKAVMSTNMMLTNVSFVKCEFINNRDRIIQAKNTIPVSSNLKVNILFESLIISHNHASQSTIIAITKMNVHINGTFNVTNNRCRQAIIHFHSCDILFSGKMMFSKNDCKEVISLNTHIKVMKYANISFFRNSCRNDVISVETSDEYNQPHPFCLFQYVTIKNDTVTKDLVAHYTITFKYNFKSLNFNNFISINRSKSASKSNYCTVSFCRFIFHCKWFLQPHFMITLSTLLKL